MGIFDPFGFMAGAWDYARDNGSWQYFVFALAVTAAHVLAVLIPAAVVYVAWFGRRDAVKAAERAAYREANRRAAA